jgi:hypothetical protein
MVRESNLSLKRLAQGTNALLFMVFHAMTTRSSPRVRPHRRTGVPMRVLEPEVLLLADPETSTDPPPLFTRRRP